MSQNRRIPASSDCHSLYKLRHLLIVSFILIGAFVESVHGEDPVSNKPNDTSSGGDSIPVIYDDKHDGHVGNKSEKNGKHGEGGGHHSEGLHVASFEYENVRDPLIFTIVIILAAVTKIVYHHADFLSSRVPESCILIVFGTVFGAIIHFCGVRDNLPEFFQPHEFFIYLLPPIILEAAYSLHDRTFGENIGSILLFAVVGTILACTFIGLCLFGLVKAGAMGSIADLGFVEIMVFASLIVAVDPVAVLAVFNEVGVNHVLYFLVFGESLLNDGVTVVLYKVFQAYNVMDEINGLHIFLGIVKFFVVCIGGLVLGILAGLATALVTKATKHVKVAEPMVMYCMAYLGFLLAELFEFSGIISIVGCGLTQRQYAFHNISDKSTTTIKYFTKVISTACEIIIFLFLGLVMVNDDHYFHVGFTVWTIVLCFVFRFIIIFGMTFLINWLDSTRVRKIGFHEQFMIAYGGLRGAVCFSLVALLSKDEFPEKRMFVTTTLAVIIFTVFVQGITIKPLVFLLQISLAPEKNTSMYVELNSTVTDHLMAGIEDIIGDHGKNHLREKLDHLDQEYLQPIFTVEPDPCATQLKEFYEHLILKEHLKYLKLSGAKNMQNMPELPHVTTELFLSSFGHHKTEAPGATQSELRPETPPPTVVSDANLEPDVEIRPRGRSPTRRSFSYTPGEGLVVSSRGLRSLLLSQQRNSRLTLTGLDKNLTKHNDMSVEIRKKSHQNKRLQRMISVSDEPDLDKRKRFSWSDTEAEVCRTRGDSMKRSQPPPRHCFTLDMGTAEPPERAGQIIDPVNLLYLSSSAPLSRVAEEEEAETEISPMIQAESGEDSDEESRLKRRRSSKNKLKRQGGMDDRSSSTNAQPDEGKREGQRGSGDEAFSSK